MRALALAAALALVSQAAGETSGSLTVSASSTSAGARPVQLALTFHTRLQCGSPGGVPLHVTLPAAARVPQAITASDVTVDGKAARKVTVVTNKVTVMVPAPRVLCDIMGPGKVTLVFTRAAGLGNPRHAGSYAVTVGRAQTSFRGTLRIVD